MKPPAVGGVVALAVVLVDQIVKAGVLAYFAGSDVEPTPLTPFLDLALRWNRGISFSLFARDSALGQIALVALDFGGDGLAHFVAVSIPISASRRRPWIDYRRRSGQCNRSGCARRRRRLSRSARFWTALFRLQCR